MNTEPAGAPAPPRIAGPPARQARAARCPVSLRDTCRFGPGFSTRSSIKRYHAGVVNQGYCRGRVRPLGCLRAMPWESAFFVARRGWSSVLKKTSHVYLAWVEALDEDFVDYEEQWRPFPELLPFRRLESDLQFLEIATLVALLRGEPTPSDEEEHEASEARLLPPPSKLSDAQRALFETLEYESVAAWPDDLCKRLLALDEAELRTLAARWGESPGSVLGSSADIGRQPDWLAELTRMRAFFEDLPPAGEDGAGPLFCVVRCMN